MGSKQAMPGTCGFSERNTAIDAIQDSCCMREIVLNSLRRKFWRVPGGESFKQENRGRPRAILLKDSGRHHRCNKRDVQVTFSTARSSEAGL